MFRSSVSQSGSSLFEVLVSVLILGLGMLGGMAVQTTALRNAGHWFEWMQADRLGQALLDTMRSHRADALAGQYHTGGFACADAAPVRADLRRWLEEMREVLGETACAQAVCPAGAAGCAVTIRWGRAPGETDGSIPHELSIGARL